MIFGILADGSISKEILIGSHSTSCCRRFQSLMVASHGPRKSSPRANKQPALVQQRPGSRPALRVPGAGRAQQGRATDAAAGHWRTAGRIGFCWQASPGALQSDDTRCRSPAASSPSTLPPLAVAECWGSGRRARSALASGGQRQAIIGEQKPQSMHALLVFLVAPPASPGWSRQIIIH